MGKNGKNKLSKGIPKAEFPPLRIYLEDTTERAYVKIPIDEVVGKSPRLCIFIGVRKTWETDVHSLTNNLEVKRKSPIDFAGEGKCWAFYFDEDAGNLYNEYNDPNPILGLNPAPKQEYVYEKVDKSSKPAFIEKSQRSNSFVSPENKKQEKPIHNSTSLIKKDKRTESILPKQKGNEKAPKELTNVNKKPVFTSDSNTSSIKGQSDGKAAPPQKIEKALDEQQKLSPGELFRSGKEYENKGEFDKAIQAYRAAADAGFNQAGYKLGKLLMKLATEIFQRIAGLGHAGAQRELEKLVMGNPDSLAQKKTDEETEALQDLGSKGKSKDERETPSAPVKKETERKGAGGITEVSFSNCTTCIGENTKPMQEAYLQAILNLIARYQLAKYRSDQVSAYQHADAENLLKKASKESDECPHSISLALVGTTCDLSVTEAESCSGEGTPTNHTTVNFFDAVDNESQVIIQEVVRHVTYWSGNDCLPELIRVDCPEPKVWEFTRKNGQEFSAESIVWTEDFTEVLPREEESPQNEAEDASDKLPREDVGEPSWGDIFALIFRKLFSIFRK